MLTDQPCFRPEGSVSYAKGQVPLQTSPEFVRTYHAQAHEITDAIAAAVINAQAGLIWLSAQPLDLEQVRKALNSIVSDGQRACEIVVRLRALMNEGARSGWGTCAEGHDHSDSMPGSRRVRLAHEACVAV
jgi:hypothetical protein